MTGRATPSYVYLDHNATAPVRDAAVAAIEVALRVGGNPSSVHGPGRLARRMVEEARAPIAALVGADAENVVFTGSGTEANNLALKGGGRSRLLVSAIDHPAVRAVRDDAIEIPVDENGVLRLDALSALLAEDDTPTLVSVMMANNETGVLQPIAEVARMAREHGALVHTDAVQAAGKIPIDMAALGVHMLSLSAHKIGGPSGVGALVLAPGVTVSSQVSGGGQEKGLRAGTENIAGIAGFGAAAQAAKAELDAFAKLAVLRDGLEASVRAQCVDVVIYGEGAPRLANTSYFSMPGVPSETQVMALDLAGFAVSAGSACASGKVAAGPVLAAMGAPDANDVIRVSLGVETKESDIQAFLQAWTTLYTRKAGGANASAAE